MFARFVSTKLDVLQARCTSANEAKAVQETPSDCWTLGNFPESTKEQVDGPE